MSQMVSHSSKKTLFLRGDPIDTEDDGSVNLADLPTFRSDFGVRDILLWSDTGSVIFFPSIIF